MHYLGGKFRTRKRIGDLLNAVRRNGQTYWEPFVGSAWVLTQIHNGPAYASDIHEELIAMWQALMDGWEPPSIVTEEDYEIAKLGKLDPATTAFIGFGSSFSGKWFGGYARGHSRNYALDAKNSLMRKVTMLKRLDPEFFVADFMDQDPPDDLCLIYCDPPYDGTTGYGKIPDFDHKGFWQRVRILSSVGHTIIVSEYEAPDDFVCLLEMNTKTDLRTRNGSEPRIEKLFSPRELFLPQKQLSLGW
jgi:DNA adenine methylase